jgi:hypothetical protein
MSYEPDPEEEEAERVQWREWLMRQEHRLAVENWLRERLLTEREFIFQQVAKGFDLYLTTQQVRDEIADAVGELRAELSRQRAAEKADGAAGGPRPRRYPWPP